jgi:hypothetical protein
VRSNYADFLIISGILQIIKLNMCANKINMNVKCSFCKFHTTVILKKILQSYACKTQENIHIMEYTQPCAIIDTCSDSDSDSDSDYDVLSDIIEDNLDTGRSTTSDDVDKYTDPIKSSDEQLVEVYEVLTNAVIG